MKKEVVAGASGKGAITYSFPLMLNELVGTKFKIVTGYQGGNASILRWSATRFRRAQYLVKLESDEAGLVAQWRYQGACLCGPKPSDLPGVPSVSELVKTDDEKKIVDLVVRGLCWGARSRRMAYPADRLAALRGAFDQTMKDKDFPG